MAPSSARAAPAPRWLSGSQPRSCSSESTPAFKPRWLRIANLLCRLTRALSLFPGLRGKRASWPDSSLVASKEWDDARVSQNCNRCKHSNSSVAAADGLALDAQGSHDFDAAAAPCATASGTNAVARSRPSVLRRAT